VKRRVRHGDEMADPRNLISLLQLGLKAGDTVVLSAAGRDAAAALQGFHRAVTRLTPREKADAARAAEKAAKPVLDPAGRVADDRGRVGQPRPGYWRGACAGLG
jgi:phosphocarrier protein FPr